jgi:hypothetical protein
MINRVTLTATMRASLDKINQYLQEGMIQSPEILAQVEVLTSGSPIHWTILLQPQVFIRTDPEGKITLDEQRQGGVQLNVKSIEGDFPSWLRNATKNILNTAEEVKEQLRPHARKLIAEVNKYL